MGSTGEETKGQRLGLRLRRAREELGYSLEEAEQATNIHARHLEALEQEDYDALPNRAWARGFMVTYANRLGLEGEALAEEAIPQRRQPRPVRYATLHWRGLVAASSVIAVAGLVTIATVIIAPYNVFTKGITDALESIAPGFFLESGPQRIVIVGFAGAGVVGGDNVLATRVADDGFGLLAIPGSTRTRIPGHGRGRIGDAIAVGGPDLTRRTVARLTDTEMPHYLVISTEGVRSVVGRMGGVRVDVPEGVSGRETPGGPIVSLPPGQQTLDGDEALVYLQGNDLRDDTQRVNRQQVFLYAMFRQALDVQTLISNPTTLVALFESTETNLSFPQTLQLVGRVGALRDSGASIEADVVPYRGQPKADGSFKVDRQRLQSVSEGTLG